MHAFDFNGQEIDATELSYRWTNQLFVGGIEIKVYDIGDNTLLLTLQRGFVD